MQHSYPVTSYQMQRLGKPLAVECPNLENARAPSPWAAF